MAEPVQTSTGVSLVAAYAEGLVNWATFAGALCFAVGGVLQLFERPAPPASDTVRSG